MYDKSKKTWSQRLKIQKNDKSPHSINAASVTATASPSNSPTTSHHHSSAQLIDPLSANVGHNVSVRSAFPAHYQISPATVMHLPTALQLSDYHAAGMAATYDYMTGRSMKYAEPWIYGTVRGIPARPAGLYHPAYAAAYANHPHAAAIFAAPTETAMAVVLCSCPEYLSGTKGRTLKKASVCKKCKGTRLPLANIGGTVRVAGNIQASKHRPVGASSTVRVVSSTKKQRPTILDPQKDPYDLMRRTRLLSPEPGGIPKASSSGGGSGGGKDKSRSRGKSASPVRGRSRTRHHQKALLSTTGDSSKAMETVDDSWLTEGEDLSQTPSTSHSRKSILRCNVNPYDLISINAQKSSGSPVESYTASQNSVGANAESSKKSMRRQKLQFSQNEFMPPNDDFNVQDAALTEDDPPFLRQQSKQKPECNKTEISKQREETFQKSQVSIAQQSKSKKPNYSNVQAIAGQRISLGAEQQTSKSLIQQSADGISTYESFSVDNVPSKLREAESGASKSSRPDSLQVNPAITTKATASLVEPKRPPRSHKQQQVVGETKDSLAKEHQEEEEVSVTVTVTPTYNIKSILKRPASKSSESGDTTQTDGHSKASTPSTHKHKDAEPKAATPTNARRQQGSVSSPTNTSQFYIPMPQARKKVQFMVEDKIDATIADAESDVVADCDSDDSGDVSSEEVGTNYEYYNRKRNQKKHQIVENTENFDDAVETNQVITYDEQFIQAMLLEKLQLDSELVTKRQQQQQTQQQHDQHHQQQQQQQHHNTTLLHINENDEEEQEQEDDDDDEKQLDDISQEIIKTNYENRNSTFLPESSAIDATTTGLGRTTKVSLNRNQENDTNTNTTKRQSMTITEPPPKTVTLSTPANSPLTSMPTYNVTEMKGKSFVSYDEDLPARDNCILTLIENGDNGRDGSDGSDGLDDDDVAVAVADVVTSLDGYDDNNVSHGDGDVHAVTNAISIIATAKSMDRAAAGAVQVCHKGDNNHDDDVIVNVSSSAVKAQHYGATKSTTSPTTVTAISSGVYYDQVDDDDGGSTCGPEEQDDVKSKQQQHQHQHHHHQQQQHPRQQQEQQQQTESQKCNKKKMKKDMQTSPAASGTTDSTRASVKAGVVGSGSRKPTKETQSRNPIRRSQSERQQPSSMTYHQSNKNNNNFKSDAGGDDEYNITNARNSGNSNTNSNSNSSSSIKQNISNGFKDTVAIPAARYKINGSDGNNGELNFHDTMALRKRSNRNDTRDLFTMGLIGRPRDPPPPPPPSSGITSSSVVVIATALKEDVALVLKATTAATAAHLEKPSEVITTEADAIESRQQTVNGLESKQQKTTIGQANTVSGSCNGSDSSNEINGNTCNDKPRQQQQQQQPQHVQQIGRQKKPTNNAITQTQVTNNGRNSSVTVIDDTVAKDNSSAAPTSKQQRTVVRVAPFNMNPNTFEVHRLKITHTDSDNDLLVTPSTPKTPSTPGSTHSSHYSVTDLSTLTSSTPEYGQQKTSILITGDDCYNTMNLSCDDSSTPHYQSSVVVTDGPSKDMEGVRMTNSFNTVTINVSSPRSSEDELILQHNQLNNLLKRQAKSATSAGSIRAIIPIRGTIDVNLQRSASSTSSTSTSSMTSTCSSTSSSTGCTSKRGKTLIRLDYDKEMLPNFETVTPLDSPKSSQESEWLPHETELLKILRNPVEAVKRNLVPHICKLREEDTQKDSKRSKKMKDGLKDMSSDLSDCLALTPSLRSPGTNKTLDANSFIGKLLEDPMLNQVAEGLEPDTVAELIENSLKRLQESRSGLDMTGTKDNSDMGRLIGLALKRIQEERFTTKDSASPTATTIDRHNLLTVPNTTKDEERLSNRGSISSANSFASAHNYELFDFDANESDCYQSCSSEINSLLDDDVGSSETKSKFYQMLVDATLQEIELSTNTEDLNIDEHQYESIRHNIDPIYEEISDVPPPLPLTAPPLNDPELEKKSARSIFEGASKYDILSYLVDAKERGVVKEEPFDYPLNCSNPIIIEEESSDTLSDLGKLSKLKRLDTISSRSSILSDSSEDNQSTISSLSPPTANNFMLLRSKQAASDIERNDSGVGSETSKTSRSKYLNPSHNSSITSSFSSTTSSSHSPQPRSSPLHLCEDCDGAVETQLGEDGIMFAPLVCRKCGKKRVERKEIITEIVETEEKYGRDLQIILEEFCHPMLVAGLLTQEQLSAIFLNTEELLENNQTLAERMRDALDIALEQGDDDLLTVNIGKIFLESTQMLHAFESYCVRQAGASLLLANLEKDKELLRIFLKVSQMENAVLRRMNLNSFLMVPVQRVTKYPLLLARLYKVTPSHLEGRDLLKQAQEKIELHLNHINQEAKDVPTKLWRRISSSSPNRRASCEIDMINIKLRKMAIDVLEWNHDEVRFVMEGKLLYTQPTDSNWKKARTIKLASVNALLVTNGKPSTNYKAEKLMSDKLNFPKHTGIREASLLVVKEKGGRYALIREPLYLDRCVVCSEADWDEYFEIQEISSKDTFIFKAEDNARTKQWYTQLQYHAQGMGAWRKRRNALANIMINGMLTRS